MGRRNSRAVFGCFTIKRGRYHSFYRVLGAEVLGSRVLFVASKDGNWNWNWLRLWFGQESPECWFIEGKWKAVGAGRGGIVDDGDKGGGRLAPARTRSLDFESMLRKDKLIDHDLSL